eukprot:g67406.t1
MTDMHKDGDDEFWNQQFFQDDNVDDDYSVSEQEDEFDSDFSDSEDESDEEEVVVKQDRIKKRNVYREPVAKHRKISGTSTAGSSRASTSKAKAEAWEPRQVRERTRKLTKSTQEEFRRLAQRKKPDRKVREHKVWTQEMLLEEAKETEAENKASLKQLLKIEEDSKRAARSKTLPKGPRIIFHSSRGGINTVTFTDVTEVPSFLRGEAEPYPTPTLCKLTGKPAKYLDPKTRCGFSDAQTFAHARNQAYNPTRKKSTDS